MDVLKNDQVISRCFGLYALVVEIELDSWFASALSDKGGSLSVKGF